MSTNEKSTDTVAEKRSGGLLPFVLALGCVIAFLCRDAFLPNRVHWSNDQPLGSMLDASDRLPETMFGHWSNLEWLGGAIPSSSPGISTFLQMIFVPQMYLKIFVPFSMFFLGFGAWFFFRQLRFGAGVCVVAGLAAGLNMHYFSNACWGLGTWCLAAAMTFIALGVIVSPYIRPLWVKAALAGFCIGIVVIEAFDSGAILSLYAGSFLIFYFLTRTADPVKSVGKTITVGTMVVFFSLLIAASTLYTLIGTAIKGSTHLGESAAEKRDNWHFITTYSFPKIESLRLIIPGLFGYRLADYITDPTKEAAYWGTISEDFHIYELESGNSETRTQAAASLGLPQEVQQVMGGNNLEDREKILDQIRPRLPRRHTGSGDYIGILVVLLAAFALSNTFKSRDNVYSHSEQTIIWFWSVAAVISLVAAWGRYSFLYNFFFHLPFLNNIRNPIKFLHPLNVCMIVLAGYGMEALHRRLAAAPAARAGFAGQISQWWKKGGGFDKKWVAGCAAFLLVSILAWLMETSTKADLVKHLIKAGFGDDIAPQMAAFSLHEILLYVIFLAVSIAAIVLMMTGALAGRRAVWGWALLGLIMAVDLARADAPWIRYYDWTQKYTTNPVIEFLGKEPWTHRVMSRTSPTGGYEIARTGYLPALCHWWLENDYMAANIESMELDQAPRLPDLDKHFIDNFMPSGQNMAPQVRLWRLSNTRYLLADAPLTDYFNQTIEPHNSFRTVMLMDIVPKPGVTRPEDAGDLTVQTNSTGAVALIEYTRALPRAKLYANWITTNDSNTLATLNTDAFDPEKNVFVAEDTPPAQKPAQPDADPGTVSITKYLPKDVVLNAEAKTPAVLMLNDRWAEYWTVTVDGKPAPLLRCNYAMRGVCLTPGTHTVEFRYQAPLRWLAVSSAAFALAVLLTGYVCVSNLRRQPAQGATAD